MTFKTPKGVRDFLPKEMEKRRWVFDKFREILETHGFGEIETPAFESLELLTCKDSLGDEAVKDIYRFEDKSGRKLGLRFDLTTPIARVVSSNRELAKPLKFFYNFTRMWRYEDVSKGRYREFYQSGVEIIGSENPEADSEVLRIVIKCLLSVGLKNFKIKINSRKVLDKLAEKIGIKNPEKVFRELDKIGKKPDSEIKKELEKIINKEQINEIFKFIKMDPEQISKFAEDEINELKQIKNSLDDLKKYVEFDFSIVRGLDYYTGFIFETIVKGHEDMGSIASGGRYDKLIEKYGGEPSPATGVGIGVERILEIINEEIKIEKEKYFICVIGNTQKEARKIRESLLEKGHICDIDLTGRGLSKQLKYASNFADNVIIIGPEDVKRGKFTLRNMKTGKEEKLSKI